MAMQYHRLTAVGSYEPTLVHKSVIDTIPAGSDMLEILGSSNSRVIAHDLIEHVFGIKTMLTRSEELTALGGVLYGRFIVRVDPEARGKDADVGRMLTIDSLISEAVFDVMRMGMPRDLKTLPKYRKYFNTNLGGYDEHGVLAELRDEETLDKIVELYRTNREGELLSPWSEDKLRVAAQRVVDNISLGYYKAFTIYGDSFDMGELYFALKRHLDAAIGQHGVTLYHDYCIGLDRANGKFQIGISEYGRRVVWLSKHFYEKD